MDIDNCKFHYRVYQTNDLSRSFTNENEALQASAEDLEKKYPEICVKKNLEDSEKPLKPTSKDDLVSTLKQNIYYAQQEIQLVLDTVNHALASEKNTLIDGKKPVLRLMLLSQKQGNNYPFNLEDLKLILATKQEGLKDLIARMEKTANKISQTFEAEKNFYEEITTGLKRLGWSVEYLSGSQKGLYIYYGFQGDCSAMARILRKITTGGENKSDVEHSIEIVVPHKEKTRIHITTTNISSQKNPENDIIYYDEPHKTTRNDNTQRKPHPFDVLSSAQKNIFELETFQNILKGTNAADTATHNCILSKKITLFIPSSSKIATVELLTGKDASRPRARQNIYDAFLELIVKLRFRSLHRGAANNNTLNEEQLKIEHTPSLLTHLKSVIRFDDFVCEISDFIEKCVKNVSKRIQIHVRRTFINAEKVQWTLSLFSGKLFIRLSKSSLSIASDISNTSHIANTKDDLLILLSKEIFTACVYKFMEELRSFQYKGISGVWDTVPSLNTLSGPILRYNGSIVNFEITPHSVITKDPHLEIVSLNSDLNFRINLTKANKHDNELPSLIDSFRQAIHAMIFYCKDASSH